MSDLRDRKAITLDRMKARRRLQRRSALGTTLVVVLVVALIAAALAEIPLLAAWAITSIWDVAFWPVFWLSLVVVLIFGGGSKAS